MLDFLNHNAGAFSVLFSFVVTFATVIYAWLTWRLVSETRVMRRAQTEPVVAIVLAPHQFRFGFAELLLVNEGTGPARDVKFVVEPVGSAEPELLEKVRNLGFIRRGVQYMSPRQEIRTFLASMIERNEQRMNTNIRVRVSYRTPIGELRSDEFELDFSPFWGYSELGKHPLVAIEGELEKIQKHIASVVGGFRKIPVRTYTMEEETRANRVSLLHLKLSNLGGADFREVEEMIDSRYHGPLPPASENES